MASRKANFVTVHYVVYLFTTGANECEVSTFDTQTHATEFIAASGKRADVTGFALESRTTVLLDSLNDPRPLGQDAPK